MDVSRPLIVTADRNVVVELRNLTSLSHLCSLKKKELEQVTQQNELIKKELTLLRLERKWCFDQGGERIVISCEEQALKICQTLVDHPHLSEDVVRALRKKCTDLEKNLTELQIQCDSITDKLQKFMHRLKY